VQTAVKYGLLLTSALLAGAPAYASSITSFSFTTDPSAFTSVLVETMSGTQASLTGSVTCVSVEACSGEVGTFNLGLNLTDRSTPISVDISGVLSGTTDASGSLDLTSLFKDFPFSEAAGSFDKTILSIALPPLGPLTVHGALDLSLAAGQSIALPLTISVGPVSTVPEPSGQALLIIGFLGLAAIARYRASRAVSGTRSMGRKAII
jgi:hypothetical protein